MKVVSPRVGMLSNQEVLAHLTKLKERYTAVHLQRGAAHSMKAENLETVMKETREYLETKPCATQTEAHIEALMTALGPFALEKAELLNIVNERPATVPELDCVVEEMDQRFSDDDAQRMLEIIKRELPEPPRVEAATDVA